MGLVIASWGRFRVPSALMPIAPKITGPQNILFRQMLQDFVPPSWTRHVVVIADAGFAANATLRLIAEKHYGYVFAMPRTRKFTNGQHLRDLVQHLPKSYYYRRASTKPDGRRQDYWVFVRHATLQKLGDVTLVLSKKRRNTGPKQVKIIVTNLTGATAGTILSIYARRWGVEICQSCNLRRTLFWPKFDSWGLHPARRAVWGGEAWRPTPMGWPPMRGPTTCLMAIPA